MELKSFEKVILLIIVFGERFKIRFENRTRFRVTLPNRENFPFEYEFE